MTAADITPFKAMIRSTLTELLKGDINGKTLSTIERFCRAQREAIIAIEAPQAALKSRMAKMMATYPEDDEVGMAEYNMAPLAGSPQAETYGVNAIRELVGPLQKALGRMGQPPPPSPADLVDAMVRATKGELGEAVLGPLREKLIAQLAELPEGEVVPMIDAAPKKMVGGDPFATGAALGLTGVLGGGST